MKTIAKTTTVTGAIILCLFFMKCIGSHEGQLESAIAERDSLLQVNKNKDSAIHNLSASFKEIESNLESIEKKKTGLLAHVNQAGDIPESKKDEINNSIKEINNLMARNSDKIRSLNSQLKKAKFENAELSKMVAILADNIMNKNEDLVDLSRVLVSKNKLIDALGSAAISFNANIQNENDTIKAKEDQLKQKENQMNIAYYLLGSSKELKKKHILDTKGKLVSNFNKDFFKQIDARKKEFLPGDGMVSRGIIKLLTLHPKGSYEFVKNDHGKNVNVKIKDQQDFWRLSKYLIIETN
jgi:hypothetical protein